MIKFFFRDEAESDTQTFLRRLLEFISVLYSLELVLLPAQFFTVGRILPRIMLYGAKACEMNLFISLHNKLRKKGPVIMR